MVPQERIDSASDLAIEDTADALGRRCYRAGFATFFIEEEVTIRCSIQSRLREAARLPESVPRHEG